VHHPDPDASRSATGKTTLNSKQAEGLRGEVAGLTVLVLAIRSAFGDP
jgi:hypothetical protein